MVSARELGAWLMGAVAAAACRTPAQPTAALVPAEYQGPPLASAAPLPHPAPSIALLVDDVAPPAPPVAATRPSGPVSPPLRDARFHDPMPGGYVGGWYGDTGLDIAGHFLPVYAVAAGTLDYSERGHTRWMTAPDTPFSVRIALDEPVAWTGQHRVTHVYYTHMSRLEFEQPEGAPLRRHVVAGDRIGTSGIGNGVPHLHLGVLLDGLVEQDTWDGILREDDIRKLFGGYRNGELLPKLSLAVPQG